MPVLDLDRINLGTALRGWSARTIYLLASFLALLPVLRTPLVADDFVNPFQQVSDNGAGLANGLEYGWKGATEGASFRIVGNLVGTAVNALWLQTSAATGIRLEHLYSMLKFVVLIACAASVADFVVRAARYAGRQVRFGPVLWAFSGGLFLTLQIHAFWSNDPVASYPLSGFGAAAIGFLSMSTILGLVERPTWTGAAIAGLVGGVSVLYYELNAAALAGGAFLVLYAMFRRRSTPKASFRLLVRSAVAGLVPAGLVVLGRFVTGGNATQYTGTTTRISGEAARTFVEGMISCLPGSAWRLSHQLLGPSPWFTPWGFAVAGTIGVGSLVRSRRRPSISTDTVADAEPTVADLVPEPDGLIGSRQRPSEPASLPSRVAMTVVALALLTYWTLAIALQAITVKVQDESLGIGYVYTASAIGSCVVSVAIVWLVDLGRRHITSTGAVFGASFALLCFVSVQQSVNWKLSARMDTAFISNSTLLAAFDDDVAQAERCARLERWTAGAWPDYYEIAMIDGLDIAFRSYFGESFCADFVRTP